MALGERHFSGLMTHQNPQLVGEARAVGEARERVSAMIQFTYTRLPMILQLRQSVIENFRMVEMTLPVDGSCDHELKVKGISDIEIGDWTQGSEAAPSQTSIIGVIVLLMRPVLLAIKGQDWRCITATPK